ncbi:MAG: hypothetical protein ABSH20_17200 [Tepidisphaeraceae bacterium]
MSTNPAHLAERVLQSVADRLRAGRREEAARLFLEGMAHHILPDDQELLDAIQGLMGRDLTLALILAFADFRCFYCRQGFEECPHCVGTGSIPETDQPCERCLSLGHSPCDFCGGSGRVTYSFAPAGLRPAIASCRSKLAIGSLRKLDETAIAALARGGAAESRGRLVRLFLDYDRNLASLRDALDIAHSLRSRHPPDKHFTEHLYLNSSRAAIAAMRRMHSILEQLAAISQRSAKELEGPEARELEQARAALFDGKAAEFARAIHHKPSLFSWRSL